MKSISPDSEPKELRAAILALRPFFVRAAWLSVFASLLVLAPAAYMLEVYERVVNSRSYITLFWLTVCVIGIYAVMEVLEWARSEVMRKAALSLDQRLHQRVFDAIFIANVQRTPGGTFLSMQDLRKICDFLFSPALLAIMEAPIALVMMVLLFLISPVLGWMAVGFAIAQVMVTWFNERSSVSALTRANMLNHIAQLRADDTLRNSEVIEAMGMLRNTQRRWLNIQHQFLNTQASASEKAGGFQALSKFLQTVLGSALLGVACWLSLYGALNGGDAMMIISSILGGRMLAPLVQVVGQWHTVVNMRGAYRRLHQLLEGTPVPAETMALPAPTGQLLVEPLVAGVPGSNAAILRGITFQLNRGDVLAIVGPSASGKTTLARVLIGLWPAVTGKVRLDSVDIYAWDKKEVGAFLGYLPQGVQLFEGTIAQNIARFGAVEMLKVEAAARAAGLHAMILALPDGYDTDIGPSGMKLSGGQRQRIGLARAFFGDPAYIVLDEPNSSLDEEGDHALSHLIADASKRGSTVVVITHRVSVLNVANKMLVIRDGQMQAFGPRDEVLAAMQAGQRPVAVSSSGPQEKAGAVAPSEQA